MNNLKWSFRTWFLICGISLLALLGQPLTVLAANPIDISLNAPTTAYTSSSLTVSINIEQVSNLNASDYRITFDSSMLVLEDVKPGKIGGVTFPVKGFKEVQPGVCNIISRMEDLNSVSGSGVMAYLSFQTLTTTGSTLIDISNVTLSDIHAVEIEADWSGDTLTISKRGSGSSGGSSGGTSSTTTTSPTTTKPDAPQPTPAGEGTLIKVDLTGKVDEQGKFISGVTGSSEDKLVSFSIESGNTGWDSEGRPLTGITVDEIADPAGVSVPANFSLGSRIYDFGPDGAIFADPITIIISYDPADLPEGVQAEDLKIAWYNSSTGEWVDLECVVDTVNCTVSARVTHFTVFTILFEQPVEPGETGPATPANPETSSPASSTVPTGSPAAQSGTPAVSTPLSTSASGDDSGSGTSRPLIIALIVAAIVILVIVIFILRRPKSRS